MSMRYTLARKTLPVQIQKATSKRPDMFLVFHAEHPDMVCLSSDGNFNSDDAFSLTETNENGELVFMTRHAQHAETIQKILMGSKYNPLTVLHSKKFISDAALQAIAVAIVETEYTSRQIQCSLTTQEKTQLFRQLCLQDNLGNLKNMALQPAGVVPELPTDENAEF